MSCVDSGADRVGRLESAGWVLRLSFSWRQVQKKPKNQKIIRHIYKNMSAFQNCVSIILLRVQVGSVSIYSWLAGVQNVICATVGKPVRCGFKYEGYGRVQVCKIRPVQDSALYMNMSIENIVCVQSLLFLTTHLSSSLFCLLPSWQLRSIDLRMQCNFEES